MGRKRADILSQEELTGPGEVVLPSNQLVQPGIYMGQCFNNCGYVMLKGSLQSCTPMRECYVCFQELLTSHAKPYGTNCDRHSLTWHSTFKCIMQCSLITHYYVILNHYGKSDWLHHGKQLDTFTKRSFLTDLISIDLSSNLYHNDV